jgi:glycosyltransferase involved in cell wall biosynthesis
MFPDAPLFTLVYNPKQAHPEFAQTDIRTSFIQKLPFGPTRYQWYLPYMPTAVERYPLQGDYDVVLSSAASFSKGVITLPKTLHISYIHSPTRYLWSDTTRYVDELPYPKFLKWYAPHVLSRIRQWDYVAAQRPDILVANSRIVQQRIEKYYRRTSEIMYPPVDVQKFTVGAGAGGYFLTGGRLVTYKRFDLVVDAFNRLGLPLKIYGSGPALKDLQFAAKPNIEFLGRVPDAQLPELYKNAVAFINPQEEDFGITAVEAMAAGRPVIAFKAGGALETVKPGVSGVFFDDQDWESLSDAVIRFRAEQYDPAAVRAWSETFSTDTYMKHLHAYITTHYTTHQQHYA